MASQNANPPLAFSSVVDPRRVVGMHGGSAVHPAPGARPGRGPVLYWMHREHRARDNWALLHAHAEAARLGAPLAVVWCLANSFLGATIRQFGFLLRGMEETQHHLAASGIPLVVLRGNPPEEVVRYARSANAALVVTDFDVLRLKRTWLASATRGLAGVCPLHEVDGRNVVPCRGASPKREYAARTLRPKIHRLLPEFLTPIPALPSASSVSGASSVPVPDVDWASLRDNLAVDRTVAEVGPLPGMPDITPGEDAARVALGDFIRARLHRYHLRNDPNAHGVSGLSPYLHFGMLSAQRAALAAQAHGEAPDDCRASFLEELIVRRELADNFCLHAQDYDAVTCFPDWALATLDKHRHDPRPALYDEAQLAAARTADPLWNAAQTEMVFAGRMHGYLRMYWAKQILLWSPTPEDAVRTAVALNDRYFLDGRDSNGYTGIAWSMGGVHDRPWGERPVQGTIRSMTYNGARSKFDVGAYIRRMQALRGGEGEQGTLF
ncbi:deoxyribodipyrimidine photo-lyase [Nitratidesulfovibrio sp. SRB-5]|uniref:deoxyribodipyrimidine photo-lyase n=1 Tax=Nitratidesulfovibrio sp. SRB-5 TaxID=2872636 RepID=UPI00102657FE|nr:deoxyribodipyrimidine photo-lyase [Nitratidesulfovibrio sp. SRB-5]RXF75220.1 deoxyribodipyrimidine photolyase [Desulfovibrio sp. DS-1]